MLRASRSRLMDWGLKKARNCQHAYILDREEPFPPPLEQGNGLEVKQLWGRVKERISKHQISNLILLPFRLKTYALSSSKFVVDWGWVAGRES